MKVYIGSYPNWLGPYQLAELTTKVGVSKAKAQQWGEWLSETWVGDVVLVSFDKLMHPCIFRDVLEIAKFLTPVV